MYRRRECYDEVLFSRSGRLYRPFEGDGVIVLHTIGSHGQPYYNRLHHRGLKIYPNL